MLYEGKNEVPAILLGYTGEEVEYGIVVVRVGERNFAVGINRGEEVLETTREASLVGLVRVVDNIAKGALNIRLILNMEVELNMSRERDLPTNNPVYVPSGST